MQRKFNKCVTNKEICLVRIVFILCKVLCHLFAGLLIEKKGPFFLAIVFAVSTPLLRHNCYYDIIRFQIDLVILASSKNFDNRLHNLMLFFFFHVISF